MNKDFLYTLLDSMSVSGHEIGLQKKVIAEMRPHCDAIRTDRTGNVICVLNPDAPFKVLLAAHIDEIGLVVTHIQDDGLLRVTKAGGVFPGLYPGHQVVIHGQKGKVYGSVVHARSEEKKEWKLGDLYIDIGAKDGADARNYVRTGDPVHANTYHQELLNGCLAARAVDDRGCAFIILEALKRAKELGCKIGVYAATTVGEETTGRGAYWAGTAVEPDLAIVTDVTYATDYPGMEAKDGGMVRLGQGPVLCSGSLSSEKVNDLFRSVAQEHNIPLQLETSPARTYTDADQLHFTGPGVVTALLSLPLRYMHAPSEVCHMDDIRASIELLARFLCRIDSATDLDPFHE